MQEDVTQAIVAAIAPEIDATEQSQAARRRPGNLTAYELALRARVLAIEGTNKADRTFIDQSTHEAQKALAIDPDSVLALNVLAIAHGNALHPQMAADREHVLQETMRAAARAIEVDGTNSAGYALRALCILHGGQLERYADALADARRAHEMNPNDTAVLQTLANWKPLQVNPTGQSSIYIRFCG